MSLTMDLEWWIAAAGGLSMMVAKVGFEAAVCEVAYLKYMHGVEKMSRLVLWLVLGFLKRYPPRAFLGKILVWKALRKRQGQFECLSPRGTNLHDRQIRYWVRLGIEHLSLVMREISLLHFTHPNNAVPHFPRYCVGSIDTFPIFTERAYGRYQPKYAGNVVIIPSFSKKNVFFES